MINVICIGLYFFLMLIWVMLMMIGSNQGGTAVYWIESPLQ